MAHNTDRNLLHQTIYSVFVRNHTKEGTFRALEGDLPRIRSLGTDIVWLMPIHPIGEVGRKGTLGSPYAIRDYRAINPEYGTMADFTHLVNAIHQQGMKCIIDVVYNHTSPDSVLTQEHPEFFLRDGEGRPTRKVADWWDVVDLDYTNRELWRYQIDTLKQWVAIVDGFRCDVASSVPVAFWVQARQEVAAVRPDCLWLAESVHGAYVQEMRRMGADCATDTDLHEAFDLTYEYDLWPYFESTLAGETPLVRYTDLLNYQELTYPTGSIKARFLENHDTPRVAASLHSEAQLKNWLAFLYFRRGTTMLYGGTERGCRHQVGLFDKDDNFAQPTWNMERFITRCKAMKMTLPLGGAVWFDTSDTTAIGHYDGAEGKVLGIFDLTGDGCDVAVDLPDGTYTNRLGGIVTVAGGRVRLAGEPVVI